VHVLLYEGGVHVGAVREGSLDAASWSLAMTALAACK
jgi:hypothetical protein